MNAENNIGSRIKLLRKNMGLTQELLAEKTGIDSKHLSKIENGSHLPTYRTLKKLSQVLKLDINDIVNDTDNYSLSSNPLYLKALKILNSARNDDEITNYYEILKLANKLMRSSDKCINNQKH